MRIICLQHASFEGPGNLASWAEEAGHDFRVEPVYEDRISGIDELDMLVVIGGPMSTKDDAKFPWLKKEKALLAQAIDSGKKVLGICFGAQLVAEVLGARVYRNTQLEIGWFPVELTDNAKRVAALASLPPKLEVFHWHGDTFDLPKGALHLASSAATPHQAFSYGDNVLALQFHLEATGEFVGRILEHEGALPVGRFVQSSEKMLDSQEKFSRLYGWINDVMTSFVGSHRVGKTS